MNLNQSQKVAANRAQQLFLFGKLTILITLFYNHFMSFAVAHCVVLCHAPLCKMYERDEIYQNNSRETKQKININKAIVQSSNSFFGALLKFRFTNGCNSSCHFFYCWSPT